LSTPKKPPQTAWTVGWRHQVRRYLLALAMCAVVVFGRYLLQPVLGPAAPLLPLLIAPFLAASLSGLGPGIVATLVSAAAGEALFVLPAAGPHPLSIEVGRVGVYLFVAFLFCWLIAAKQSDKQKLIERERRLTQVLEAAPSAMLVVESSGRIVMANGRASEVFGYSAKHLLALSVEDLLPAHLGTRHQELREAFFARPATRAMGEGRDLLAKRKDGTTFSVEVGLNPLSGFKEKLVLASVVDITQRKVADSERRERDFQFKALFDGSPIAKYLVDPEDGSIVSVNQLGGEQLGYDPKEMVGLSWAELFARGPMPREQFRHAVARRTRFHAEGIQLTKTGQRRDVLLSMQGMEAGGRLLALVVSQDITRRKQMERELRQHARQKDEFVAMLAHELRNPLSPLTMGLALLDRSKSLAPADKRTVDMLQRQTKQMTNLVNDLLEMALLTRGRVRLARQPVVLQDLIRQVQDGLRTSISDKRLTLMTSMQRDGIVVSADRTRLGQVLENLLNNAIKFTPEGGQIQVNATLLDGGVAQLSVEDTGVGIAQSDLERVFEMFAQSGTTIDRSMGGLGLGLAVAKMLVQMHDGKIEAHSAGVGRGAKFVVTLPDSYAAAHLPRSAPAPAPSAGSRLRVLVVDDHEDAANTLVELLESAGHEVTAAYDGPLALKRAKAFRPDIAFLDIGLPGMSGYELAEAMRAEFGDAVPFLVALTGYGQPADVERSKKAGFDRHLVKPADPEEVLALARVRPVSVGD
jgi:PAS domain S-box-containing protein